jgi:hypothetical protein
MRRRTLLLAGSALTLGVVPLFAQEARDFGWIELLPGEGKVARPVPLEEHDEGGDALLRNDGDAEIRTDIDGLRVRMVGYVTPVGFKPGSRMMVVDTFLLAPFTGACVHVPPPPANQLLLCHFAEGIELATRLSLDPVMLVGTLKAEKASVDITVAGYQFEVESAEYVSDERSSSMDRFVWGTN